MIANSSKPGVLIVDDQPANRRLLAGALSTLDVNVIEAQTGEEALAIARQGHELCVVLLDVHMPGMDGYTLASELRQNPNTATLPIVFISADEPDAAEHARTPETGAVDFLSKPVSPRILLSKVRVFLELFLKRGQLEAANDALHKQTERLETTAKVSRQITSILDLDQLLLEFLSLVEDRFGHSYSGIWIQGDAPRPDAIVLRAGKYGTHQPALEPGNTIPINAVRSIIAHVFRTGETYLSSDTRTDPVYLKSKGGAEIRSELALPLRFGHSLVGVLDIQSEQADAFSPGDIAALSTLADQVAVALRNARLYDEVRRLNEDLEAQVTQRTVELEQAYQQLELLDRSKSDFITVVSHELRTPLTLINGFSQMLRDDEVVVSDVLRKQLVDGIVAGARRMGGIVDSMLDVVKIDSRTLRLDL
ncbi:MAG: response regulator, partial [Anaerolineae bacterium]|nr:response regulator [Anaerolineae bacterium]